MTLAALTRSESPRVSELHPLFVSYFRMFSWNRDAIFYVKCEFLLDNLKRFPGDFALYNIREKCIYIFLRLLVSYYLFIVFIDRERLIESANIRILIFAIVPRPALRYYPFFCHGEVFLCHGFIVAKW